MSKWIKKDDQIVVVAGNNKGMTGKVLRRQGDRVVVQGINIRKKHVKSRSRETSSRILELEMPIHISNVSLCDANSKPIKLKVRQTQGSKELIYLDGEKEVIHRQLKKGA